MICIVAGEPTNLIAESNSTHVTVSWKSPGDPVTGYVIYYQSEGGGNSSDIVSGGETESHSLDCLESGVIYYIYIVALSLHLPSPLVGPVTVIPGLPETSGGVIKTSGSGSIISHFSVSTSHIFNTVTIEASGSTIKPSSTTTVSSNAITVPAIGTTYTQLSNIDISGVITPSSYPPGKKYVAI